MRDITLQKIISANYWIFGEEYNLVSEDVDFEKALRNYLYIIRGVKKDVWMKNPDKYDRMDLFLSRQDRHSDTIRNVIIELKHPTKVNIGLTEWDQVMRVYADNFPKSLNFLGILSLGISI